MTDKKPILNKVKQRLLILSPTVKECLEREANKGDFYREGDRPIGKGGFGEVWRVTHKLTGKVYCIKVISKKSIIDQKMVEQMNREIEIMYMLHHPHIIKLVNHFEDDDSFYLVMQLAAKGQLYTHLKRIGRYDQRVASQFLRETINALMYLHSFKPPIIHRDIKPENILLDENNRVKLADFGWSNYEKSDDERKTYCGTPEYLAPEMLTKKGHDTSIDIWSVGILMFELLCGNSPFVSSNQEELFSNIKKHKITWPSDFPPLAKSLVTKILKPNPKERISLEEILEHAFFKQNTPIYKPLPLPLQDKKSILESHLLSILPENYQKEINTIVDKINNLRMTRNTINNNQNTIMISTNNSNNSNSTTNTVKEEQPNKKKTSDNNLVDFNSNAVNFDNKGNNKIQNNTLYSLQEKINNLEKENIDLKKKIETITNDIVKLDNSKSAIIKSNELENSALKKDLEKYLLLNKERINILAEVEEKNNKIFELECNLKSKENEVLFLKESNESLNNLNQELKNTNLKLEDKNNDLKKKLYEANSNNEAIINDYQKKLEVLQMKFFESNNRNSIDSNSGSTFYSTNSNDKNESNILELVNENINEFKKLFSNKIEKLSGIYTEIKEDLVLNEKTLISIIENRHAELVDLINKLNRKMEDESDKLKNIENKVNVDNKKSNKETWLNEIITELQPYKTKFLKSEDKILRLESEIALLNDKVKTNSNLYNEAIKDRDRKNDELKLKENRILKLEDKLGDIKNYVCKNFPQKLDELAKII